MLLHAQPSPVATNPVSALESPGNPVESILRQLVRHHLLHAQVSPSQWSSQESALLLFCTNVLSSSMKPSMTDETCIIETIKKKIVQEDEQAGLGLYRAVKISDMIPKFLANNGSSRKWAILYFLLRVSERERQPRPALPKPSIINNCSTSHRRHDGLHSPSIVPPNCSPSLGAPETKNEAWRQYNLVKAKEFQIREIELLQDLIFVLQGVDGRFIQFCQNSAKLSIPSRLIPNPAQTLLLELAELGVAYREIQLAISYKHQIVGCIRQSFVTSIQEELRLYLKTIATLESIIDQTGMTMRRIFVWLQPTIQQIQFLRSLTADTSDLRGASLISFVHRYHNHGSQFVREVTERIVKTISLPLVETINSWVFQGLLNDPYNEFFVKQLDTINNPVPLAEVWHRRYEFVQVEVPTIISQSLAEKIYISGKSRCFFTLCKQHVRIPTMDSHLQLELEKLEEQISKEYARSCNEMTRLFYQEYRLIDHFKALKDYLLFGRGDFSQTMMDALGDYLGKPAGSLLRHNLVSILETSLRSCNPFKAYDPILANFDVRFMELSTNPNQRQTGWDVFSLDYRVNFPLDIILSNETMREYQRISQFLWNLKRVQSVLGVSWKRLSKLRMSTKRTDETVVDFRRLQLLHQEASQLMNQMSIDSFEAIKTEWVTFLANLLDDSNNIQLDAILRMHREYLVKAKRALVLWTNQNLKVRVASLLSSILKIERVTQGLAVYIEMNQRVEHQRQRGSKGNLEEDGQLEQFKSNQLRMLTEQRAAFQTIARQFQNDVDELLLQMHKEACSITGSEGRGSIERIIKGINAGGYHERRNGFDGKKYCSSVIGLG